MSYKLDRLQIPGKEFPITVKREFPDKDIEMIVPANKIIALRLVENLSFFSELSFSALKKELTGMLGDSVLTLATESFRSKFLLALMFHERKMPTCNADKLASVLNNTCTFDSGKVYFIRNERFVAYALEALKQKKSNKLWDLFNRWRNNISFCECGKKGGCKTKMFYWFGPSKGCNGELAILESLLTV